MVEKIIWYVVFTSKDVKPHKCQMFLKKNFYHCFCFRQIDDVVYYIDPTTADISSSVYIDTSAYELAKDFALKNKKFYKVLQIEKEYDFNNRICSLRNMIPNCVNVVKMFIGLKSWSQTPYQLYKHLLRNNARIL
mgnify:CR=1 FL=1